MADPRSRHPRCVRVRPAQLPYQLADRLLERCDPGLLPALVLLETVHRLLQDGQGLLMGAAGVRQRGDLIRQQPQQIVTERIARRVLRRVVGTVGSRPATYTDILPLPARKGSYPDAKGVRWLAFRRYKSTPVMCEQGWTVCLRGRAAAHGPTVGSDGEKRPRISVSDNRIRGRRIRALGGSVDAPNPRVELYAAIRRDARAGLSGRALERKHGVGRRTVLKALSSVWPEERKKLPPRSSKIDPYKPIIDAILRVDLDAPIREGVAAPWRRR